MALSKEYFDFHLTKNGWVAGSERLDHGDNIVPEPADTLLTRTYKELVSHSSSGMERSYEDRGEKTPEVLELLAKFPHPYAHYEKYFGRLS